MGETRFRPLEAEKAAAAKRAEELKQQLAAQSYATQQAQQAQQAQKARDEQASPVKTLEAKLTQQTGRLGIMANALPRLRQLAHQPTP